MNIMKSYSFCYAHRVWNQVLSGGRLCLCRNLHGHSSKVELTLTGPQLNNGMILDFNELKVVKEFIDNFLDHKTLIDRDDPLVPHYLNMLHESENSIISVGCLKLVDFHGTQLELKEFAESLVILPFVPTSENLANWLADVVKDYLMPWTSQYGVVLKSLKWWESETSYAEWVAE